MGCGSPCACKTKYTAHSQQGNKVKTKPTQYITNQNTVKFPSGGRNMHVNQMDGARWLKQSRRTWCAGKTHFVFRRVFALCHFPIVINFFRRFEVIFELFSSHSLHPLTFCSVAPSNPVFASFESFISEKDLLSNCQRFLFH